MATQFPHSTNPRASVTLIGDPVILLEKVREEMEGRLKTRLSAAQIFTMLMAEYLERVAVISSNNHK